MPTPLQQYALRKVLGHDSSEQGISSASRITTFFETDGFTFMNAAQPRLIIRNRNFFGPTTRHTAPLLNMPNHSTSSVGLGAPHNSRTAQLGGTRDHSAPQSIPHSYGGEHGSRITETRNDRRPATPRVQSNDPSSRSTSAPNVDPTTDFRREEDRRRATQPTRQAGETGMVRRYDVSPDPFPIVIYIS